MSEAQPSSTLNELIEVTRDGQRFYEEASDQIGDETLRTLFLRLVESRRELIDELSTHVAWLGESPAAGGTIGGTLRTLYGELRAGVATDRSAAFVAQLEKAEDRLMHAFEHALEHDGDRSVRAILSRHFPKVRAMHDEMRNLKQNLAT